MLGVIVDAAVLMVLLKTVNDDDMSLGLAVVVALVASISMGLLSWGLVSVIGAAGIFLAPIIVAAGLGVAVSALFGAEIKRSFLIATIFVVVHIGFGIGFRLMLSS